MLWNLPETGLRVGDLWCRPRPASGGVSVRGLGRLCVFRSAPGRSSGCPASALCLPRSFSSRLGVWGQSWQPQVLTDSATVGEGGRAPAGLPLGSGPRQEALCLDGAGDNKPKQILS